MAIAKRIGLIKKKLREFPSQFHIVRVQNQQGVERSMSTNFVWTISSTKIKQSINPYNTEGCKGKLYGNFLDLLTFEVGIKNLPS